MPRDAVDWNKGRKRLFNYKSYSFVGPHIVRMFRNDVKHKEIAENFKISKLCVLGLVNHKVVHDQEHVFMEHLDGSILGLIYR